jgi:hypothetical protein
LANGRLHRVHQGVYVVGRRTIDWRGVVMAAVLACGSDAVVSHQPHCVHRLDRRDVATIDGIPVTTLARTLLDVAEVAPKSHVIRALTEAERKGIIDLKALPIRWWKASWWPPSGSSKSS